MSAKNDLKKEAKSKKKGLIAFSPLAQGQLTDKLAGGIVEKNMPIDQSNVMLVNPETGKGERVGFKEVDGKKVRVFKSNGAEIKAA